MKYLCIIIAIALLIVGIILIVTKAKGKVFYEILSSIRIGTSK